MDIETKAIRVFYRKSDNQIVWNHELQGTGKFSTTVIEDLMEIPSKMPDGITPIGGVPEDYACIEETDVQRAKDCLASDENSIVDGKLIIGERRPIVEPELPRNLAKEVDEIKAQIVRLEGKR